jgi:hypothetical protein
MTGYTELLLLAVLLSSTRGQDGDDGSSGSDGGSESSSGFDSYGGFESSSGFDTYGGSESSSGFDTYEGFASIGGEFAGSNTNELNLFESETNYVNQDIDVNNLFFESYGGSENNFLYNDHHYGHFGGESYSINGIFSHAGSYHTHNTNPSYYRGYTHQSRYGRRNYPTRYFTPSRRYTYQRRNPSRQSFLLN